MSARREVYAAVQAAFLAATAADGATAAKVIPAMDGGPRPRPPFVALRVISMQRIAEPEAIRTVNGAGNVEQVARTYRDARVSIQGFGEVAVEWIDAFLARLDWPVVRAHIAARETASPRDLSQWLDNAVEDRAECEIGVYVAVTDNRALVLTPLASVGLDSDEIEAVITFGGG